MQAWIWDGDVLAAVFDVACSPEHGRPPTSLDEGVDGRLVLVQVKGGVAHYAVVADAPEPEPEPVKPAGRKPKTQEVAP